MVERGESGAGDFRDLASEMNGSRHGVRVARHKPGHIGLQNRNREPDDDRDQFAGVERIENGAAGLVQRDDALQMAFFHRAFEQRFQLVQVERLLDVVVSAAFHARDGRFDRGESRRDDDLEIGVDLAQRLHGSDAVHPVHLQIGDGQVELPALDGLDGGIAALRGFDLEVFLRQLEGEQVADSGFVVNDKNAGCRIHAVARFSGDVARASATSLRRSPRTNGLVR